MANAHAEQSLARIALVVSYDRVRRSQLALLHAYGHDAEAVSEADLEAKPNYYDVLILGRRTLARNIELARKFDDHVGKRIVIVRFEAEKTQPAPYSKLDEETSSEIVLLKSPVNPSDFLEAVAV